MARLPSYIARVDTGDGPRYEVRLHARRADGSRFQHKKRFKTPAEATEWYSKITAELASGTHTPPSNVTVREAVEQWLAAKCARVKPTTAAAYKFALAPVVERYGDVKVQRLTKLDAETLITELRTGSGERATPTSPACGRRWTCPTATPTSTRSASSRTATRTAVPTAEPGCRGAASAMCGCRARVAGSDVTAVPERHKREERVYDDAYRHGGADSLSEATFTIS